MKSFRVAVSSLLTCGLLAALPGNHLLADDPAPVESLLRDGRLAEAAATMKSAVDKNPQDQQARFSLGVVQFLQAIERLGQDQHRFGLLAGRARSLPFMRLPIPENPNPEQISYQSARDLVQRLIDQLQQAEQTLSGVTPDDVRLPLKLGLIRLDLNGDGKLADEETMWHITQILQNPRLPQKAGPPKEFPVVFDGADVLWLQGYCHALSAIGEIVLAHDWQDQFERTAHLFYPNVDSPYDFLAAEGTGSFMSFGGQNLLDVVALLHTINYEVFQPERMQKALMHMETVIRLSRRSWQMIEEEEDDELEWIPNDQQTSLMRGFTVGRELMTGWQEFLDEMELILQGKKLVPFWRGIKGGVPLFARSVPINPELGINVRKIFTQPTRFDLALWLQGTGFAPYLETGEITSPEKWQKMMRSFRGQFFTFALWFN